MARFYPRGTTCRSSIGPLRSSAASATAGARAAWRRSPSWLRPAVPDGGRLLDLGGGTGALAAHLADALRLPRDGARRDTRDARLPARSQRTWTASSAAPRRCPSTRTRSTRSSCPTRSTTSATRTAPSARCSAWCAAAAACSCSRWTRAAGCAWSCAWSGCSASQARSSRPTSCAAFMSERGIDGECVPTGGIGYRFLGVVRPTDSVRRGG